MKNRYIYTSAAIICCLLFFTNVKAQILLVPQIEQEQNQWCWAGVTKCILDYYGFVQSQCIISEYARSQNPGQLGTTNCCASPVSCNNWNWMWGAAGSIEDILTHFGGITTNNINNSLTEVECKTVISNYKPYIIRFGWNNGGGHFVVGYGINGSDFYTMDPWFNEGYTISTYNWLLSGQGGAGTWTHSQILSVTVSAIQEQTTNKELLKVTDLLGRETKATNQLLFYIYNDGTVEKKIIKE